MRAFFAALRVALAQVVTMVWTATRQAGRIVWAMVPRMGSTAPDMSQVANRVADEQPDTSQVAQAPFEAIRKAASAMAAGTLTPGHLAGMPADVIQWLRVMPRSMLCRVACASDDVLDDHLRGRKTMRGVLVYDREAVDQYAYSSRKKKAHPPDEPDPEYAMAM